MKTRFPWALLMLLATGATGVLAQLTPEDIEALRAQGDAEGWTFTVGENGATGRSLDQLCGLVEPPGWQAEARFDPCPSERTLATTFDWRKQGYTPIKDQGGCGSCWAFATVGPLENNILLRDGVTRDLSEQWLLSCNSDGYDCVGGWWVHDYHEWKMDPCLGDGAVFEAGFPYVAWEAPCACPYDHEYWIDSWAYIGGNWPTVSQLKQAILDHGPVSAAICATSTLQAYDGGVFNACPASPCGPDTPINHAVVLVGWDDNQGTSGVWFLRNSWGTAWGEDENGISWDADGNGIQDHDGGWARIEYGCINVGFGACYVHYPGDQFTVWVDFGYSGIEYGTFSQPRNTLAEGVTQVDVGGTVWIKTGSSPETFIGTNAISKAMTLRAYGGPVTVGQ